MTRRVGLAAVVASMLIVIAAPAIATPAIAAAEAPATTIPTPQVSVPHIIPLPNSGREPQSATDPGGWAQGLVFAGIVVGLCVVGLLIRRESRRKRPIPQNDQATRASTRSEPVADTSAKRPESSARR